MSKSDSRRQNYRWKLTIAWIKANHPMVWEAISTEATNKYPPIKTAAHKDIEDSLSRIKKGTK